MNHRFIVLLLVSVLSAKAVCAVDLGISAEVGTLGAGFHLAAPIAEDLNARIGFNSYNYSSSSTFDWPFSQNYNLNFNLQSVDALLDWYPWYKSFHFSTGLVRNSTKVDAVATPDGLGMYHFNGDYYTISEVGTISGTMDFRPIAPYLGIGWGNAIGSKRGWAITSDIGIVAQGSVRSNLKSSGCTGSPQSCNQLIRDLAAENSNFNVLTSFNLAKYYPVLRIGMSYKF